MGKSSNRQISAAGKGEGRRACEVCGGPLRTDALYGVCGRNPQCRYQRRRLPAHREMAAESNRRWRVANPKKVAERERRWRAANREKAAATVRRYYAANREKITEAARHHYAANRDTIHLQQTIAARLRGRRPLSQCRSGRFCWCDWCAGYIGYRSAHRIRPSGTFCTRQCCHEFRRNINANKATRRPKRRAS